MRHDGKQPGTWKLHRNIVEAVSHQSESVSFHKHRYRSSFIPHMSSHNTSLCRFVVFEILYFTSSYCFAIIVIIDVIFFLSL